MITLARLRPIRIICRKDLNGAYFCNIGPRKLALYRDSTFYEASELSWRYLKRSGQKCLTPRNKKEFPKIVL